MSAQGYAHRGWKEYEQEYLKTKLKQAVNERRTLRWVFDEVASYTGRRPNSVRNYYYLCPSPLAKEAGARQAFRSFSEAETDALVSEFLSAAARGVSVRKCAENLSGGDARLMLRYQNKYRQLMRDRPEYIERLRRETGIAEGDAPESFQRRQNSDYILSRIVREELIKAVAALREAPRDSEALARLADAYLKNPSAQTREALEGRINTLLDG